MQRRRGVTARFYTTELSVNNRGQKVKGAGEDYIETRAAIVPQRSATAEVPGQAQINVIRLIVAHDLPDVDLWSRVEVLGKVWDIVTPPAHHQGSRQTRHWSIDVRERPA